MIFSENYGALDTIWQKRYSADTDPKNQKALCQELWANKKT